MLTEIIRAIPLIRPLIALIAGIYFHESITVYFVPVVIILAVIAIIFYVFRYNYKYDVTSVVQLAICLITFFFLGAWLANLNHVKPLETSAKKSEMVGYVTNVIKQNGQRTRFEYTADSLFVDGLLYKNYRGVILLDTAKYIPKTGERLRLTSRIFERQKTVEGAFDYGKYLEYNGIHFSAFAYKCEPTGETQTTIRTITNKIREFVINRLSQSGIEGDNLHLLQAMLLGDKSQLDNEVKQSFSDCGTIHLLAVSGMHVAIIYGFISLITSKILRRKRVAKFIVDTIFIWIYAIIAGFATSIFRATLMMTFMGVSRLTQFRLTTFNSLACALLIILAVNPLSIYSSGLWLSFFAVAGIVGFHRRWDKFLYNMNSKIGKFCLENLMVTSFAQLATLPIILSQFHTFPTYFLINNFILVPLAAPVLIIAIITFLLSFIPLGIAWFVGTADNWILWFMCKYAEFASSWPHSVITNIRFDFVDAVLLTFAIILCGKSLYVYRMHLLRKLVAVFAIAVSYHAMLFVVQICSNEIIQFQTSGQPNLSINMHGRFTHFLSDTANAKSLELTDIIDREQRARSSKILPLMSNSTITVGDSVIHVIPHSTKNTATIKITTKDDTLTIDQ